MENSKFLVIYNYMETPGFTKSQTNLSFFIRHAMDKKKWKNLNIQYLFIIKNYCEVVFPIEDNVKVLRYETESDFDAWDFGIKSMTPPKVHLSKLFDYIFFLNSDVLGPLIDSNTNSHWMEKYFNKIQKENSIICSNIITDLPKTDLGGPGLRISPYTFLLKINPKVLDILRNTKIKNISDGTTAKCHILENTVFGKKKDRMDSILTGEYGISKVLISNGYIMSCLIYESNDYKKVLNNNLHQDRYLSYNGDHLSINDIPFYKNTWIWDEMHRVCLPLRYQECINFTQRYFYRYSVPFPIDHRLISVPVNGVTLNQREYDWNSKEIFYSVHGIAEEAIVYPLITESAKNVAIYHHYDSDMILKDYVIQGINALLLSGYDVLFYTSCKELKNVKEFPVSINYMPNYGAGTDLICYYEAIKNNNLKKYEYLFFTNDSVIFPIYGVDSFKRTILKHRQLGDFWGHWSSNDVQHHFVGTLIELNVTKVLDSFMEFLQIKVGNYKTISREKHYYIYEVEVKILQFLLDKGFKSSCVLPIQNFITKNVKAPFNPISFYKWMKDPDCFAIKWKYMVNYIHLDYFNNPYMNQLLRYVHFGPHGPIGNYQAHIKTNPEKIVNDVMNGKLT